LLASLSLQCSVDLPCLCLRRSHFDGTTTNHSSTHGPPRTFTYDETSPTRPPRTTGQPATALRLHTTPPHFRLRFSRLAWRSSCA
jgi:hypothetical protein